MTDEAQTLWITLDLDPGTADFFGLPSRVSVPDHPESPFLGGYDSQASLEQLAEALAETVERTEPDPEKIRIRGFLTRWPRYADLTRYLRMGSATFVRTVAAGLLKEDPGDPPALAAGAILEARKENWDAAIALLERVRDRAPTHALSRLQLALCLAGAGRLDEAREGLEELMGHPRLQPLARLWMFELERNPDALREKLGGILDRLGGLEEESSDFEAMAAAFPDNPETLYARAMAAPAESWREEGSEPEQLLRRALSVDSGHAPAAVALTALLRSQGKREAALEVVERAWSLHREDPLLLAAYGQTLELLGRAKEAGRAYRAIFELPLARLPGSSVLIAGQGLIRLGHAAEARRFLEDAEEARPGDPLPPELLARMDEGTSGAEAAERRLREAVRRCGPVPSLQYSLGDLLRRQGRTVEADGLFTVLIRRHPDSPWGYRGKGDLVVQEKPAEALEHYAEAFRRAPSIPIAGFEYLRGVSALRGGDAEEARRCLERAVAGEPDNPRYWCDLGAALFYLDRVDAAIEATERALERKPGHPGFLHNLAEYHGARFRRSPLKGWRSWFEARRLRREVRRSEETGWRKDLWYSE